MRHLGWRIADDRATSPIQLSMKSTLFAVLSLVILLCACGPQTLSDRRAAVVAAAAVPVPAIEKVSTSRSFSEEQLPDSIPGGECNFDLIAGTVRDMPDIRIDRLSKARYTGWATPSVTEGALPERVTLALVGAKTYALQPVVDTRRDVAAYFKVPALVNAGFLAEASVADVPPGSYLLRVYMQKGGQFIECAVTKKVVVK